MSENATIVLAHPDEKSTCACLAHALKKELEQLAPTHLLDLYEERFNPLLSYTELRRKFSFDPNIQRHQSMLHATKRLFLVFPLWWAMLPAILKGWFDRVFNVEFAYTLTNGKMEGLLTYIHVYACITHSEQDKTPLGVLTNQLHLTCNKAGMQLHHCEYVTVQRPWGMHRITQLAKKLSCFD